MSHREPAQPKANSDRRIFRGGARYGRGFVQSESGAIAILFGLMLPVLALLIGIGLDHGNAVRARASVASALDAALLAAARELSMGKVDEDEVNDIVEAYVTSALANAGGGNIALDAIVTRVDEQAGTIDGRVEASVDAAFSKLLKTDTLDIAVDGQSTYNLLSVELALVLDVTGSMSGQKLKDMKTAANDLIDLLIPNSGQQTGGLDQVRISLVPYSDLVNVGGFNSAVTGFDSGEACVYERKGTFAFSEAAPVGPVSGYGEDDFDGDGQPDRDDDGIANFASGGCTNRPEKSIVNSPRNFRGYACGNPALLPLSNNVQTLKSRINGFTASGCTAGHIGIQWGWYTLSPQWGSVWGPTPEAYGKEDHLKVMVVMTDGAFNTHYEQSNGGPYDQGEALCDAIKGRDIELYTVAFKAPASAETFMRQCASSSGHYFEASTGSALRDAFENIASRIRELRLSS